MKKSRFSLLRFKNPKEKIFHQREFHSIKGKNNGILILLTVLFFFSLFSVVLGKAGLDYLNYKMNDPFIKWFNIPVSNLSHRHNYAEIKRFFDKNAETHEFSFSKSSGSYRGLWRFYRKEGGGTILAFVQSYNFWEDRDLLQSVCAEDNLVYDFEDVNNLTPEKLKDGVIISVNLIKELNAELADLKNTKIVIQDGDNLPLTVLAVVKTLPNRAQVLAENRLVFTLNNYYDSNVSGSSSQQVNSLAILVKAQDGDQNVQQEMTAFLNSEFGLTATAEEMVNTALPMLSQNKKIVLSGLSQSLDLEARRTINQKLNEEHFEINAVVQFHHNLLVPHQDVEYGNPDHPNFTEANMFDVLSFKIEDLTRISAFQDVVLEKYKMELDMSQVEAKENFGVVSFMSIFLILSLVFFAACAILIYVFNLMKSHIEKISVNLGTFMAFGMSKDFIYKGYLKIVFRLLVSATLLALLSLLAIILILQLTTGIFNLPEFLSYMEVFQNSWLWLSILIFIAASFILFRYLLKTFLAHPPGDLIYNRLER